jgi:lipid-binding SYLF domain-containing protein
MMVVNSRHAPGKTAQRSAGAWIGGGSSHFICICNDVYAYYAAIGHLSSCANASTTIGKVLPTSLKSADDSSEMVSLPASWSEAQKIQTLVYNSGIGHMIQGRMQDRSARS